MVQELQSEPEDTRDGRQRAIDVLAELDGSNEAARSIRTQRDTPPTGTPTEIDALLRTGTNTERTTFATEAVASGDFDIDTVLAGLVHPTDERLAQLAAEVSPFGTTDRDVAAWYDRFVDIGGAVVDKTLDWGGSIVGTSLEVLSLPAEMTERVAGLVYFAELPLADRWHMGALTYDSIYSDLMNNGKGGRDELILELVLGASFEELEERYTNIIGDSIGKFIFDPLWLLGGMPLVGRIPLIGGTKALQLLNKGIDVSRIPVLGGIPIIGRIGRRVDQSIVDDALNAAQGRISGQLDYAERAHSGFMRQAFSRTRRARASEDISRMHDVFGAMTDPQLWIDSGARIKTFAADIARGVPPSTQLFTERIFENSPSIRRAGQLLTEGETGLAKAIDSLESLAAIPRDPIRTLRSGITVGSNFWLGAREALEHADGNILDLVLQSRIGSLTPSQLEKYGRYRHAMFMGELNTKIIPLINQKWVPGRMVQKELLGIKRQVWRADDELFFEVIERFTAGMKMWLSMALLNTPRFIVMNFANNAFTIAVKTGDVGGALRVAARTTRALVPLPSRARAALSRRFADSPFGAISRKEIGFIEELGFSEEGLAIIAADEGLASYLGITAGLDPQQAQQIQLNRRPWWKKAMTYGLERAGEIDQSMRMQGMRRGMHDGALAVWKGIDEGGVIPKLEGVLADNEIVRSWAAGLVLDNSAAVEKFLAEARTTDDLVTASSLLDDFVKGQWNKKFPGGVPSPAGTTVTGGAAGTAERVAGELSGKLDAPVSAGTQTGNHPNLLKASHPQQFIDEVDDVIVTALDARAAGDANWMTDLIGGLDDMADDLDYTVFRMREADNLPQMTIPLTNIATKTTPWQVRAQFDLYSSRFNQLMDRLLMPHQTQLGGEAGMRAAQMRISSARDLYIRQFQEAMTAVRNEPMDARALQELALIGGKLRASRNDWILRALDDVPQLQQRMAKLFTDETVATNKQWAQRLVGVEAEVKRSKGIEAVGEHASGTREAIVMQNDWLKSQFSARKMQPRRATFRPEQPSSGAAATAMIDQNQQFIKHVQQNIGDKLRNVQAFTDEELTELGRFGETLKAAMRDRNLVMQHTGRGMRDFVALNYSQKYGIDAALSVIFPYHFWIGRTMQHWMKLTLARPGATAAYARAYDTIGAINEDANLPARLKNSIRIPLPFLEDALGGLPGGEGFEGALYFDPIRILFPLASQQNVAAFDSSTDSKPLGHLLGFAEQFTSANPFITGPMGAIGALGDRDAYVRRALATPALPLGMPGPRVVRAAWDYFAGISEDPDPTVFTQEIKEKIAAQEPMDEGFLKSAFKSIWDFSSTAGYEDFRVDRMISSMVGNDPHRWTPESGLQALKFRTGPLFQEARRRAATENGTAVLTGWLFMPMRLYPEGESVQRGLDAIFREAGATGDPEVMADFFAQHPEYQVRRVAIEDRDDGSQAREVDSALFHIDLGKIQNQIDPEVERLRFILEQAEKAGYLQTKEGRRLAGVIENDMALLLQQQEEEVTRLEGLYPNRINELSLRASPRERALFELRTEFFSIKASEFSSSDGFFAARDLFISKLPADDPPDGRWLEMAVRAIAIWDSFGDRFSSEEGRRDLLTAQRREQLEGLTATARPLVSRAEFQAYIEAGRRPATPERLEYDQASKEIQSWFAIAEAPGLTTANRKALQGQYWRSHPLLEKYYGRAEPRAWDADSAVVYERMQTIWKEYFALRHDPQASRDHLASNLEELNELRVQVGLPVLELIDEPPPVDFLQADSTDPHEQALNRRAGAGSLTNIPDAP